MATTSAPEPKSTAVMEIERMGFKWELVPEFDLTKLSPERRIQVRDSKHYAPPTMVKRMAAQMKVSVFEPIVVTRDFWIDDGNTRVGARALNGDRFCPAYVIDVDWEGPRTTNDDKRKLRAIGATLNSNGGRQLEKDEMERSVRDMIEMDWKSDEIIRALGMTPNKVNLIRRQMRAEERLEKVGFEFKTELPLRAASLRALGNNSVQVLNDTPFKEVAELARDAGLQSAEINEVAKAAKDTGSDTDAIDHIRRVRVENTDRITAYRTTGGGKPPASGKLRQSLGYLLAFEGRPAELLERSPNLSVVADHEKALRAAVALLQDVLRLQEAE